MFDESIKSSDYSLAPSLNYTGIYTLFGAVKLTKNADFDKYKHSGYCIGFDSRERFLLFDGSGIKERNHIRC